MESYEKMFLTAVNNRFKPFPWQVSFATDDELPDVLCIPTGLGKTAGAILGWVWRRRFAPPQVRQSTPRRLVYCLPMRVLVRQTTENARSWLSRLELLGEAGQGGISVNVLMGGEIDQSGFGAHGWDAYPEEDAILIGTQDQLLSRALNRGYAMSRFKWPVHFGLLNSDVLWIIDETQLMGAGFPTTAQLNGLRSVLGTSAASGTVWMSATLNSKDLETVDNIKNAGNLNRIEITDEDLSENIPEKRFRAVKKITEIVPENGSGKAIQATSRDYPALLADTVLNKHQQGTLTLVMLNRVNRAQNTYKALKKKTDNSDDSPEIVLLHSRFRQEDRLKLGKLLSDEEPKDLIVVSTQVLEAGIDISSRTLVTELAPWSSMIQRFGRCNRYGEFSKGDIICVDLLTGQKEKKLNEISIPYEPSELVASLSLLKEIDNASPESLSATGFEQSEKTWHIPRKRDLQQLFSTTPDLMGFDIDVSRFIRDTENADLQVFWRNWDDKEKVPPAEIQPVPEELCRVSVSSFREFFKKLSKRKFSAWTENHLDGSWRKLGSREIRPGLAVLLNTEAGGYSKFLGWTGNGGDKPDAASRETQENKDSLNSDRQSTSVKDIPLHVHIADVHGTLSDIISKLQLNEALSSLIEEAALWHDAGKAHPAFQNMLGAENGEILAKSGKGSSENGYYLDTADGREHRKYFRHELASALWYMAGPDPKPLAAYLIASHHGKVRTSIRSNPRETLPEDGTRLTCGIREGDSLPSIRLAPDLKANGVQLSLDVMELGGGGRGRSWTEMVNSLLDAYGPFRLAWMEALLRTADWRASRREAEDNA